MYTLHTSINFLQHAPGWQDNLLRKRGAYQQTIAFSQGKEGRKPYPDREELMALTNLPTNHRLDQELHLRDVYTYTCIHIERERVRGWEGGISEPERSTAMHPGVWTSSCYWGYWKEDPNNIPGFLSGILWGRKEERKGERGEEREGEKGRKEGGSQ